MLPGEHGRDAVTRALTSRLTTSGSIPRTGQPFRERVAAIDHDAARSRGRDLPRATVTLRDDEPAGLVTRLLSTGDIYYVIGERDQRN